MDSGSWWPDGDTSAGRITTALWACISIWSQAAPGLRPWRGSQLHHVAVGHSGAGGSAGTSALARITTCFATGFEAAGQGSAGTSALARITTPTGISSSTPSGRQRRDFGPGEDHNTLVDGITGRDSWAAPGLRPWRGSQHSRRLRGRAQGPEQRRDFGPGEDHNYLDEAAIVPGPAAAPGLRPWRGSQLVGVAGAVDVDPGQRRDFGPGEDHNAWLTQMLTAVPWAAPGLRPWRGSQRPAGPGEIPRRQGSAGTSALARITTQCSRTTRLMSWAALGLRPWRGSQLWRGQ